MRRRDHPLWRALAIVAAGVAAAALVLALTWLGVASGTRTADRDRLVLGGPVDDDVVVVAVDADTISAVRETSPETLSLNDPAQADLAEALVALRPRLIVWGLPVPRLEPTHVERLEQALTDSGGAVLAIGVTPVRRNGSDYPTFGATQSRSIDVSPPASRSIAGSMVLTDGDGRVRSMGTVARDADGYVPDLAPSVATAALILDHGLTPEVQRVGSELVFGGSTAVEATTEGGVRLRFPGALTDEDGANVVSGADVLAGTADLDDKVVLVGYTHPDLAARYPTAAGALPPVVLDATLLNTIVSGSVQSPVGGGITALTALVGGGLAACGAATRRFRWLLVSSALAALLVSVVFAWQQREDLLPDRLVGWSAVALAALVAGGILVGERFVQRRRLHALFGSYVPAAVADELLRTDAATASVGERRDVAVLFCDLRGFTPVAGTLEATEVRRLLERFYGYVCTIILDHGGTVMQFVGDEVFAVFGAPLPVDQPGDVALACARELLDRRPELDERLAADGLPPMRFGVGIHSGSVIAAHVEGAGRRQYAMIGDTVNMGSRLCGLAGADQAVISALSITIVPSAATDLGEVTVRGRDRPLPALRLDGYEPKPRR